MCETDYSGYPDCRDDAIKAMQVALNLGMATRLVVETPLMWIDKAATWRLARDLGGETLVDIVRERPTPATKVTAAVATIGALAAAIVPPARCALPVTRRFAPPAEARRVSFRRQRPARRDRFGQRDQPGLDRRRLRRAAAHRAARQLHERSERRLRRVVRIACNGPSFIAAPRA